jgi:ribosome-associated protein
MPHRRHRHRFSVPDDELTWRFSRSSGPGGQHVNTTDTRVELIWSLADTAVLTDAQKALAQQRLRHRLVAGRLTVVSAQYRSQHRNREAARTRLEELIDEALVPPKPRRATAPSRGSVERRLAAKRRRGATKKSRGGGWPD